MSAALAEYFDEVISSDVFDYGFGSVADFLNSMYQGHSFDWVITNPPFKLAEKFITRSMKIARRGVAMLTRTVFIESIGRYKRLSKENPPSRVAQFAERVERECQQQFQKVRPSHNAAAPRIGYGCQTHRDADDLIARSESR
jgi:hypothetical protein